MVERVGRGQADLRFAICEGKQVFKAARVVAGSGAESIVGQHF